MANTKLLFVACLLLLLIVLQSQAQSDGNGNQGGDGNRGQQGDQGGDGNQGQQGNQGGEGNQGGHGKPKKVKCQDKASPCYHVDLYCPNECLRNCHVDCNTCKAVCQATFPPPTLLPPPPPPAPTTSTPPPSPTLLPPPPPTPTTSTPPPSPTTPARHPPPTLPPPTSSPKRAKCKNLKYPACYGMELTCPSACPDRCEVDCVTCSPVCKCNRPGAVCQDPRFVGADGLTFYFHGKKDADFCIVSDTNLHINARFIGLRNPKLNRDFTWVQSLGILFDNHKLFIGAKKTSTWDDSVDRIELQFDGDTIILPDRAGTQWNSTISRLVVTRTRNTNSVDIEVENNFKIKASVVPITEKDSRIHSYGITQDDCFAHLDVSFKFYSLSGDVNGVLGQTYASNYVSKIRVGALMPVVGGQKEFSSSSLFSTDCTVSRYIGRGFGAKSYENFEYANLDCASTAFGGRGVVCRR